MPLHCHIYLDFKLEKPMNTSKQPSKPYSLGLHTQTRKGSLYFDLKYLYTWLACGIKVVSRWLALEQLSTLPQRRKEKLRKS
jgi:hypothetical protein